MMFNPLLKEMSVEDLQRRYNETYVRYKDQILFLYTFSSKYSAHFVNSTGMREEKVDFRLFNTERPAPRWVMPKSHKMPVYVNYLFNKQWHRGFCALNTVVRYPNNSKVRFPSSPLLAIFNELYAPLERTHCRMNDVEEALEKTSSMILSPQILIHKNEKLTGVWFREMYIGPFGAIHPLFVQEVRELIGDYENGVYVPNIRLSTKSNGPGLRLDFNDEIENIGRAFRRNENALHGIQGPARANLENILNDIEVPPEPGF